MEAIFTTKEVITDFGSLVSVYSFRGELIDEIQVKKFSGLKTCQTTNGLYGARFQNATDKAHKIYEKFN